MKTIRTSLVLCSLLAAATLAGCGGGGGGEGAAPAPIAVSATPYACNLNDPLLGAPLYTAQGPYQPAVALPGAQAVTISGTARFESVPYLANMGSLNYAAITTRPIRGAVVELLQGNALGAVVARANTDANGAYSLAAPVNGTYVVRVRAQMYPLTTGQWNFAVRDNTQSDAMYSIVSPAPIAVGTASVAGQDLTAGSGWTGMAYSNAQGSRAAGPFAILDTVYSAYTKVLAAAPNQVFPPLNLFWSKDNRPVVGNLAAGEISTSFFRSDTAGNRAIYILGAENADTDEYDASVVAHEWGHYFQNAFSRDDSVGGDHSGGQFLDMRVAFSEGWGNAWSGMALGIPYYADSRGVRQQSGFRIDLALPVPQASSPGWYKEDSVQYILYTLHQQVGFAPIWQTMAGPMRGSTATTSLHAFAKNFTTLSAANAASLNALLSGQNTGAALNACGSGETNTGTVATSIPIYRALTVGQAQQMCISSAAGTPNKLGNFVYFGFTAPTARTYTISVTGGPAGSDPDFELYQRGYLGGGFGNASGSETASGPLQAGEAVLVVGDANISSGQSPCFTVLVQ